VEGIKEVNRGILTPVPDDPVGENGSHGSEISDGPNANLGEPFGRSRAQIREPQYWFCIIEGHSHTSGGEGTTDGAPNKGSACRMASPPPDELKEVVLAGSTHVPLFPF
jgi:hypothetical protein